MHLPYVQVTNEVLDQAAPELALVLGRSELEVLGALIHLFRWARGRCPDDKPPSASALVRGPAAARLIAQATHLPGLDPEAFVEACTQVQPDPLLEVRPNGIRIRGLKRYDAAWGKNHAAAWRAWKEANPDSDQEPDGDRSETVPEPARNRSGTGREPGGTGAPDADADADAYKTTTTAGPKPVVVEPDGSAPGPEPDDSPAAFKAWWRAERQRLHPELGVDSFPRGFDDWHRKAFAEVGFELGVAATAFLEDEHFRRRNWVVAVFMPDPVWRSRVSKGPAPPRRNALTGVGRGAA